MTTWSVHQGFRKCSCVHVFEPVDLLHGELDLIGVRVARLAFVGIMRSIYHSYTEINPTLPAYYPLFLSKFPVVFYSIFILAKKNTTPFDRRPLTCDNVATFVSAHARYF